MIEPKQRRVWSPRFEIGATVVAAILFLVAAVLSGYRVMFWFLALQVLNLGRLSIGYRRQRI